MKSIFLFLLTGFALALCPTRALSQVTAGIETEFRQEKKQSPEISFSLDTLPKAYALLENAPQPLKWRSHLINYGTLGLYPVSMYWLYTQWYKDYPQSSFHFFNDNKEWEQMDKFGHVWDAYSIAKPLMKCYRWAGYDNKHSTLYASGIAFLYQTTIEVFDGFSSEWGFSAGDVLCNTLGTGLFAVQQLCAEKQWVVLKYSFHQTKYAQYRPSVLGSNLAENILKDYNGLTYWMSFNPSSFFRKEAVFPKWLSVSIGFGAEGMTGGESNPAVVDGKAIPSFQRYRQYYAGLDFDLARIPVKNWYLNALFKLINIVRLPAPAIEWGSGHKPKFNAFYF